MKAVDLTDGQWGGFYVVARNIRNNNKNITQITSYRPPKNYSILKKDI